MMKIFEFSSETQLAPTSKPKDRFKNVRRATRETAAEAGIEEEEQGGVLRAATCQKHFNSDLLQIWNSSHLKKIFYIIF